jgi:hypothetical protein
MNSALEKLHDIHLPPPILMWPLEIGWILLFIIILIMLMYLFFIWYKKNKKKRFIKFSLAKLNHLQKLTVKNPENINIAAEISTLLRRTALHYFRREDIAGLSGSAWLDFLNRSGHTTHFDEEIGQLLTDAPYRKHDKTDLGPLFALCKHWLATLAKKKVMFVEK